MYLDFFSFVSELCREKPSVVILFVAGLVVFFLLVIDAHQHSRRRGFRCRVLPQGSLPRFRAQLLPLTWHWRGDPSMSDPAEKVPARRGDNSTGVLGTFCR